MINNNNILPYFRKDMSALLVLSAAILTILLSTTPLLLSSPLLQPVQAQTPMTFKTPKPATFTDPNTGLEYTVTFDAQGTATPSGPQGAKITNGTIQVHVPYTNPDGSGPPQTLTGNITSGYYITTRSPNGIQFYATIQNTDFLVESACSTSGDNPIEVNPGDSSGGTFSGGEFQGAVQCSPSQSGGGGDTTAQPPSSSSPPSSSLTGSSQGTDRGSSSSSSGSSNSTDSDSKDGDGDGIPDSSDKCHNTPNPRCFKEGDTSTTSTHEQQQQQQPSSTSPNNRTGNQTR
jgi:hypothetical protein